jgi:hypothetical protein
MTSTEVGPVNEQKMITESSQPGGKFPGQKFPGQKIPGHNLPGGHIG